MSNLTLTWRSVMMGMVVLPVLLCGLVLMFRRVEGRAARYFGAFLILAALTMGPQVIGYAGAYQVWPWLTFFPPFYTELFLGPLLIAHAHTLIRGTPLGWRRWLFVPGVLQVLYYSYAFFGLAGGMTAHLPKWAFNAAVHAPYAVPIESALGIGLLSLAVIVIWRERHAYLAFLERTESAARDYDPVWLRNLLVALAIGVAVYAGLEVTDLALDLSYNAAFPFQVLLMAVLVWLGIDAAWRLTQPFPKYRDLKSATPKGDDWSERIREAMARERWYLEPRLSIRELARRLGTNESYISRAINGGMGQSFNAYINGLRIDHAKDLLCDGETPVLSVAMESGFNSKATFNRVFREVTGATPSRFRASQNP